MSMKQSKLIFTDEVFHGSTFVRKFTFKTMKTPRDQSVHFQKLNCFECLSPHKITA